MNEKLMKYIDGVFAPYEDGRVIRDLKEELYVDLVEKLEDYKSQGYDDETAYSMTLDCIGDVKEIVESISVKTKELKQVVANFSASNLTKSDFAGVTAHKGKFEGSALHGSDFSGADLTGSSFRASDVREANFDGANLTDCSFSALDLTGASFHQSILVRTNFSASALKDAKFIDAKLTDVNLTMNDLRKTIFENCIFNCVDFKYSDLRGLCLEGQTFIGVKFGKAALNEVTFKGSTLKNVSFTPPFSLSKKYYNALKTIRFDGAMMDKLTYNALKGMGADVSKVTII